MRVLTQIKSLTREGYTIIQSTHNPDQSFMFSDRILALHGGLVLASGAPCDIVNEELMHQLYVVDTAVESLYRDRIRVCIPKTVIKERNG